MNLCRSVRVSVELGLSFWAGYRHVVEDLSKISCYASGQYTNGMIHFGRVQAIHLNTNEVLFVSDSHFSRRWRSSLCRGTCIAAFQATYLVKGDAIPVRAYA